MFSNICTSYCYAFDGNAKEMPAAPLALTTKTLTVRLGDRERSWNAPLVAICCHCYFVKPSLLDEYSSVLKRLMLVRMRDVTWKTGIECSPCLRRLVVHLRPRRLDPLIHSLLCCRTGHPMLGVFHIISVVILLVLLQCNELRRTCLSKKLFILRRE